MFRIGDSSIKPGDRITIRQNAVNTSLPGIYLVPNHSYEVIAYVSAKENDLEDKVILHLPKFDIGVEVSAKSVQRVI